MTLVNNRLRLKLFFGCLLTPDIELRLKQSLDWKHSRLEEGISRILTEAYFQEKKYLGVFWDQQSVSLDEVKPVEIEIRNLLASYNSDLSHVNIKLFIFSQIFIT